MGTKWQGNEGAIQRMRRNGLQRRPERIGKYFQLPRQRNWANTSKMVEKNKDPTAEKVGPFLFLFIFFQEGWCLEVEFGGVFWQTFIQLNLLKFISGI